MRHSDFGRGCADVRQSRHSGTLASMKSSPVRSTPASGRGTAPRIPSAGRATDGVTDTLKDTLREDEEKPEEKGAGLKDSLLYGKSDPEPADEKAGTVPPDDAPAAPKT